VCPFRDGDFTTAVRSAKGSACLALDGSSGVTANFMLYYSSMIVKKKLVLVLVGNRNDGPSLSVFLTIYLTTEEGGELDRQISNALSYPEHENGSVFGTSLSRNIRILHSNVHCNSLSLGVINQCRL